MMQAGFESATLIHPSAQIGQPVRLDEGAVVYAGNILTTNIGIGRGAQLNLACSVSHDVKMGDFVTLSPGVRLCGGVQVGDFVTIGTNASVIPGVRVGDGAIVGAGAAVVGDVPTGVTVAGVPARELHR